MALPMPWRGAGLRFLEGGKRPRPGMLSSYDSVGNTGDHDPVASMALPDPAWWSSSPIWTGPTTGPA
jgi:hypothetical protein